MSLRNQIHKLNEVDESLQRLVRLKSQVLQHLFSDYSETVNRAKSNFAPATSSGVYSCRFSNRGSPLTPITTRRSPVTRATLGAFCGISTLTPAADAPSAGRTTAHRYLSAAAWVERHGRVQRCDRPGKIGAGSGSLPAAPRVTAVAADSAGVASGPGGQGGGSQSGGGSVLAMVGRHDSRIL